MVSLEVDFFMDDVGLPLEGLLLQKMIDRDIGLPLMVAVPTDTIFDGRLVENQYGMSIG